MLLQLAMTVLKISPDVQESIWKVIAGILHLGNTTFEKQGEGSKISNMEGRTSNCVASLTLSPLAVVDIVSELLQVNQQSLAKGLTVKVMKVRGQSMSIPLKLDEVSINQTM